MNVRIKKLHKDARLPERQFPTDAGADLYAVDCSIECDRDIVTYGTGLAFEIPEGYVGLLFPRSSVYKKDLSMTNCVGVIDAHYRGEVLVKFRMVNHKKFYDVGERVAQMVIVPFATVEYEFADELSSTDRGEGGHGSTGA